LAADLPQPQILLGQLQIRERQYRKALGTANQLKKSHPNMAAGYVLEGEALVAQDRLDAALEAYGEAFERQPSRMVALRIASLLRQTGDGRRSLAVLTNWLRDHPEDAIVRQNLAMSYQSMGKPSLAEREYRAVLEADPVNVVALNNLAWLMMERSPGTAKAYALRAYELAPQSAAAADTLGWILLQLGEIDRGQALLDMAASRSEDPSIHYHRVVALQRSGDIPEARRALSTLLNGTASFPERPEAQKLLKKLEEAG
jgi:tetratricopeptide (TPR) repeat protein